MPRIDHFIKPMNGEFHDFRNCKANLNVRRILAENSCRVRGRWRLFSSRTRNIFLAKDLTIELLYEKLLGFIVIYLYREYSSFQVRFEQDSSPFRSAVHPLFSFTIVACERLIFPASSTASSAIVVQRLIPRWQDGKTSDRFNWIINKIKKIKIKK
jgi:hypothetical protein